MKIQRFLSTLLPSFLLLAVLAGDGVCKKEKSLIIEDPDASWPVEKHDFGRTSAENPLLRVPLKLAWKKEASRSVGAAPSAAGRYIFVTTRDKRVAIMDMDTGERVERHTYEGGISGSVLIKGLRMYFNTAEPEGRIYVVEINSNDKKVQKKVPPARTSPILQQDRLFVFSQPGTLLCFNAETGHKNWESRISGTIEAAPVYVDPYIFVPTVEGNVYKIESSTGRSVKSRALGKLILGDMSSDGYYLFCSLTRGRMVCLEPDSLETVWEIEHGHPVFAGPVYSDGAIYQATRDRKLIKYSARDGSELWRADLKGVAVASPAVTGKYIFTGTKSGHVAAFDPETGERLWESRVDEGVSAPPLVYRDYLFYCSDRGKVYAFHAE